MEETNLTFKLWNKQRSTKPTNL